MLLLAANAVSAETLCYPLEMNNRVVKLRELILDQSEFSVANKRCRILGCELG